MTKKCTNKKCQKIKPISSFHKDSNRKDCHSLWCKTCVKTHRKLHYLKNKDKTLSQNRKYRESHMDEFKIWSKQYILKTKSQKKEYDIQYNIENRDKIKEKNHKHYKNNISKYNAKTAKRRAAKLQRTVAWADLEAIKEVYADCEEINLAARTAGSTERYVVDHEIPLQGELVSGLHVPENLQIITNNDNLSKGNKFKPIFGV